MRLKHLTAVSLPVVVAVLALACNQSRFNGSSGKQPATQKPRVDPKPNQPVEVIPDTDIDTESENQTETFAMSESQGLIDMVWVIDNSGSMKEEASQVRSNFERFLNTVQQRSDLKIALISSKAQSLAGGSTGVTLPAAFAGQGGIQIDAFVDSNNPLVIAAAATCPAVTTIVPDDAALDTNINSLSSQTQGKICGQNAPLNGFSMTPYTEVSGRLTNFFRPEAKKVYVVVTDDEAEEVTDQNFLSMIEPYRGPVPPTLFAFRGVENRTGCSITVRGTAYERLAQVTQGAVFDICDPDWSANFDQLGKAVIGLARLQYKLGAVKVARVISVTLDGRTLAARDYKLVDGTLILESGAVPQGSKKLVVIYEKG